MMNMCIFCSIVHKELPNVCLYEDDIVMAFLDISQVTKGHTLIISKQHYDHMLLCDDDVLSHMIKVAKQLGQHLMDTLNAEGMNILTNVNEVAGQSVAHVHFHLIPRYSKEDACIIRFESSEQQDMKALAKLLKMKK